MVSQGIVVQLTQLEDGSAQVLVLKSPKGEPQGTFILPYHGRHQRQAVALALEAVKFERPRWEQVPAMFQALKDLHLGDEEGFQTDLSQRVGRTLFDALFPLGELREALHAALDACSGIEPARIELRLNENATDLGAYPWELLHDDPRGFLFSSRCASLVRYVACSLPRPTLVKADALNLLLVTARPIGEGLALLTDSESRAIEEGLADPLQQGRVRLLPLPQASPAQSTWDCLNEYLITHKGDQKPHIFHFDGHGSFGQRCASCGTLNDAGDTQCRTDTCRHRLDGKAEGYLAFEARNKRPQWVSSGELGNLLAGVGVQLAVLTACKSAVFAGESVFSGMAPALIRAGVPAVVAMQFSVTAGTAKLFSKLFYLSLGQPDPLTLAVSQARAALFVDPIAWYRPVLYLRTDEDNPEGRLFTSEGKDGPGPSADTSKMSPENQLDLVAALLKCRTMGNEDTRDAVVSRLPSDVKSSIRRSPVGSVDVANIVSTCSDFPGGIKKLIEVLRFFEGNSIPMQRVDELVR